MTKTFENPANGYREEIGTSAYFGMFFLGCIYLAYKGPWKHIFIWLLVVGIPAIGSGGPFLLLSLPITTVIYTILIPGILEKDYFRRGWKDASALDWDRRPGANERPDLTKNSASNKPNAHDSDAPRELGAAQATKTCKYCAEEIKVHAIKCKHCQSDLVAA